MLRACIALIVFLVSFTSFAITTKDCPTYIGLRFSQPNITSSFVKEVFTDYFEEQVSVAGSLKLSAINHSKCYYQSISGEVVMRATLQGSLQEGAREKAVLITKFKLPLDIKKSDEPFNYVVVYSPVVSLSSQQESGNDAIEIQTKSFLYYEGETCYWDDCIPNHISLGSFVSESF